MDEGCNAYGWIKAIAKTKKDEHKRIYQIVREDGGLFGFSFLDKLRAQYGRENIDWPAAAQLDEYRH